MSMSPKDELRLKIIIGSVLLLCPPLLVYFLTLIIIDKINEFKESRK